jgi:hypothetical protein
MTPQSLKEEPAIKRSSFVGGCRTQSKDYEMKAVTNNALRAVVPTLFLLVGFLFSPAAFAATQVVNQIDPFSANPTAGIWYENDIRGAGVAGIENLAGLGGVLENDAPLPTGATRLTTGADNNDKAEIGIPDNFGLAGDILNAGFGLSYSYFKENMGNAFAAPSIKLVFFNFSQPCPSPDADCFVTLVYEPTWNQTGFEGSAGRLTVSPASPAGCVSRLAGPLSTARHSPIKVEPNERAQAGGA